LPFSSGTPTGLVTLLDNGGLLATLTLTGGSANYATTALTPGITHVLTATYAGDSNFLGSAASASAPGTTTVTVTGTDAALTVIPGGPFTVISGNALHFELLLKPIPGAYPGPVTFAMTGLPPGATVSFTPSSLNAVTSPTTVRVVIQTAAATARLIRIQGDSGAIAFGLLLLPIGLSKRARKRLGKLSLLAALLIGALFSTMITGCVSGRGLLGQEPQKYTLTITASSGPVQHVATVTLNVQ
jgi:hypothetical protein